MYKKIILKTGLRVIAVPQKDTETVTVLVLVKTGGRNEKKELLGISHFVEHMFFGGTTHFKGQKEVIEPIDEIGGAYSAFTGGEYTGFWVKAESVHANLIIDWISHIYLNSTFPLKELEKERGTIKEELNMYLDNPMMYIGDVWKKVLYGNQPAGSDFLGTKKTISTISRKQIIDYVKSQYTGPNTVVCIAGKINEKEVVERIERVFKDISRNRAKDKDLVSENQKEPQLLIRQKNTSQAQVAIGFRAYDIFHKDRYILEVLASILGGGMSSRLFSEVRTRQGLVYDIRTYNDSDTDTGNFVTFCGIDIKKIFQGISSILKEYEKLTQCKIPKKELEKAKNYLKGKNTLSFESSNAKANFYGMQEILKGEIKELNELFKEIDKITAEDVQRVAKDVFVSKNLNLAIIGPFKDKNKFKKLLLSYGTKNNKN